MQRGTESPVNATPGPCADCGARDAGAVLRDVRDAVNAFLPALDAVAPDCLVSISLRVPGLPALMGGLDGDTCWLAPHGGAAFYADGSAARYADAATYRADGVRWLCLGDAALSPVTFFTLPPATEPPRPSLWVPHVLLCHDGKDPGLVLSARRGSRPSHRMIGDWMAHLSRLPPVPRPSDIGGVAAGRPAHAGSDMARKGIRAMRTEPGAEAWQACVAATRDAILAGRLTKAVLARRLCARLAQSVDLANVRARLARMYPDCHVVSLPHGNGRVVAATPELLATKRGDTLISHAIAGTAPRRHAADGTSDEMDSRLLVSPKERLEHEMVVDAIREHMKALCEDVESAGAPTALPLRFVQHLWTPIRGRLRPGVGLLDAVHRLHPTPAVLGVPPEAARAWLSECGEQRDGLYTGVAGWIDRRGDGDAVVVLRSAYLEADSAVLWAGAGIMAQSEPAAEWAETELKLQTMLEVLGEPHA